MTVVIARVGARYEVQEMPYGKDYAWCPGHVVVECDCGERLTLTDSATACRCGADHRALVQEELAVRQPLDTALHPWRSEYHRWRKDRHLRSEDQDWLELRTIE